VESPKHGEQLLGLLPGCDAAVLTLIRSKWKIERWLFKSPSEYYVLAKAGLIPEVPTQKLVKMLLSSDTPLWGPDAWKFAWATDRDLVLSAVVNGREDLKHWQARVLRELTGRRGGLKPESWREPRRP
jgi:hypothetical protein